MKSGMAILDKRQRVGRKKVIEIKNYKQEKSK